MRKSGQEPSNLSNEQLVAQVKELNDQLNTLRAHQAQYNQALIDIQAQELFRLVTKAKHSERLGPVFESSKHHAKIKIASPEAIDQALLMQNDNSPLLFTIARNDSVVFSAVVSKASSEKISQDLTHKAS